MATAEPQYMPEENARKNDRHETKTKQVMDTGYAWNILLGSVINYLFGLGSLKSFGVLYTEMLDHFSAGSGNTAWIGSITWFLVQVLAPFANCLCKRYSFRLVSLIGGIMVGCGYFLSGFVTRIELMYLTFTIIGIGYCLSYVSASIIISLYFKKRRTLANGVMVSAGGVAVLSFPSLYRFLINKYGLSQALWVIGAIVSNICVAGCLFLEPNKPPPSNNEQARIEESISSETDENQKKCFNALNLNFCLFKNRRFTLLIIAFTVCTFGHISNYILIPAHIKTLG
ncbi:monocarboxylate transporter 4-like [Ruditapes philippinarum]|uniref:monocarboxylate transporter 4-like n=1 Tax=Ruditapes philippinarum TaxID=129788 RepID=UPI00295A86C2|nr:monocarboxylate transporter 4-like [Ruditapes philippinarum]